MQFSVVAAEGSAAWQPVPSFVASFPDLDLFPVLLLHPRPGPLDRDARGKRKPPRCGTVWFARRRRTLMDEVRERPNRLRGLAGYAAAACLSLLAVLLVMKLWRADLRVPLLYDTDTPYTLAWIKGVIDNGWYLHNPYLGAPAGHEHEDFPLVDSLHFLILKAIALGTHDVSLVHNIYYLLTFPLVVLTSLFVLRHFKVSFLPALAASLLYAFIPGHFFRLGHLFLAAYYLLPLMVMVTLWVYLSEPPLISRMDPGRARLCLWNGKALASIVICLLVSSAGVYYAFFASFLLLVAGLAGSLPRRGLAPLALSALLAAL